MTKHIPLRDIQAMILSQAPNREPIPLAFMQEKARAPSTKPHKHPEQDLQIECCDYLKSLHDVLYFSVPNHIYLRNKKNPGAAMHYMAQQKRAGLLPGVSDLIIIFRNIHGATTICCAELKVGYGVLSEAQQAFFDKANEKGCFTATVKSVENLRSLLKTAGLPVLNK